MNAMGRLRGTVITFNEAHGHGRIRCDDGREARVSYAGIRGEGYRTLDEGDRVEMAVMKGKRGLAAVDVTRL